MKRFTKETTETALLKTLLAILLFLVILMLSFILTSTRAKADSPAPEQRTVVHQQQIITAYSNLLHEIWLDKPSYVEDALSECDAFIELDELLNGEWGDVFILKNKQDSIRYQYNWNGGESACIHTDY